jgi:hypothetical protein
MAAITGTMACATVTEVAVCQLIPSPPPIIQYYDGQGGGALANIPPSGATPSATEYATAGIKYSVANFGGRANNYSARLRGFIKPTVSGNYTFYLSSDDAGQFSLGIAGAALGATSVLLTNNSNSGAPGVSGPASGVIALVAGQYYPFEALLSEGNGIDYVQVDWSRTGLVRTPVTEITATQSLTAVRKVYRTTTTLNGVSTFVYRLIDGTVIVPTATTPIIDCI